LRRARRALHPRCHRHALGKAGDANPAQQGRIKVRVGSIFNLLREITAVDLNAYST
jgi:hypothetical protein